MESNALGSIVGNFCLEKETVHIDLFYHKNFHLLISGLYSRQFVYTLPLSTPVIFPRDLHFKTRKLRIRDINKLAKVHTTGDSRAGIWTQSLLSSHYLRPQRCWVTTGTRRSVVPWPKSYHIDTGLGTYEQFSKFAQSISEAFSGYLWLLAYPDSVKCWCSPSVSLAIFWFFFTSSLSKLPLSSSLQTLYHHHYW